MCDMPLMGVGEQHQEEFARYRDFVTQAALAHRDAVAAMLPELVDEALQRRILALDGDAVADDVGSDNADDAAGQRILAPRFQRIRNVIRALDARPVDVCAQRTPRAVDAVVFATPVRWGLPLYRRPGG
jgi:hypothetical protein